MDSRNMEVSDATAQVERAVKADLAAQESCPLSSTPQSHPRRRAPKNRVGPLYGERPYRSGLDESKVPGTGSGYFDEARHGLTQLNLGFLELLASERAECVQRMAGLSRLSS